MSQSPLRRADLDFVARNMSAQSRKEMFAFRKNDDVDALIEELAACDMSHAWVFGLDEPIYVLCIYQTEPGTWTSWGFGTERLPEIAISLTKAIVRTIIPAFTGPGFERFETCGLGGSPIIARWIEFLGAKPSATAHGFGRNGEDVIVYRGDISNVRRR